MAVPVLLTAFEPFGGRKKNRSLEAVRRLVPLGIPTQTLPVSFDRLREIVPGLVERAGRALILVGESALAKRPVLERIAVNLLDAHIVDNEGTQPRDVPVVPGGPAAYLATWPARALVDELSSAGLAVDLSSHAGTYACNEAFYLALHHAVALPHPPRIGFVHVPARWLYANDQRAARTLAFLVERLAVAT